MGLSTAKIILTYNTLSEPLCTNAVNCRTRDAVMLQHTGITVSQEPSDTDKRGTQWQPTNSAHNWTESPVERSSSVAPTINDTSWWRSCAPWRLPQTKGSAMPNNGYTKPSCHHEEISRNGRQSHHLTCMYRTHSTAQKVGMVPHRGKEGKDPVFEQDYKKVTNGFAQKCYQQ